MVAFEEILVWEQHTSADDVCLVCMTLNKFVHMYANHTRYVKQYNDLFYVRELVWYLIGRRDRPFNDLAGVMTKYPIGILYVALVVYCAFHNIIMSQWDISYTSGHYSVMSTSTQVTVDLLLSITILYFNTSSHTCLSAWKIELLAPEGRVVAKRANSYDSVPMV